MSMQLTSIRLKDADRAIEDRLDFGVRANKLVREKLGMKHSLRGYSPMATLGFHGPELNDRREMPVGVFQEMVDQMERLHAAYIIESYETVIGWEDASGRWHILPLRYSATTTQHQHLLCAVIGVSWRDIETTRVILPEDKRIGRPGF